jgi:hypothetical protein
LAEAGSVVTDTLRLPQGWAAYDNNFTRLIDETRATAMQAGYNPSSFDFDIVCTGARPNAIFGAIAYVGGPGLWLANSNFNPGVAAHELGHNFGLPHASFWFTGGRSSIGPGVLQEYGDLFDSMGVPGGSTSHFNARLKNLLGWIPDADAPLVVSNGTYRLTAHDHPNATGVRPCGSPATTGKPIGLNSATASTIAGSRTASRSVGVVPAREHAPDRHNTRNDVRARRRSHSHWPHFQRPLSRLAHYSRGQSRHLTRSARRRCPSRSISHQYCAESLSLRELNDRRNRAVVTLSRNCSRPERRRPGLSMGLSATATSAATDRRLIICGHVRGFTSRAAR